MLHEFNREPLQQNRPNRHQQVGKREVSRKSHSARAGCDSHAREWPPARAIADSQPAKKQHTNTKNMQKKPKGTPCNHPKMH